MIKMLTYMELAWVFLIGVVPSTMAIFLLGKPRNILTLIIASIVGSLFSTIIISVIQAVYVLPIYALILSTIGVNTILSPILSRLAHFLVLTNRQERESTVIQDFVRNRTRMSGRLSRRERKEFKELEEEELTNLGTSGEPTETSWFQDSLATIPISIDMGSTGLIDGGTTEPHIDENIPSITDADKEINDWYSETIDEEVPMIIFEPEILPVPCEICGNLPEPESVYCVSCGTELF